MLDAREVRGAIAEVEGGVAASESGKRMLRVEEVAKIDGESNTSASFFTNAFSFCLHLYLQVNMLQSHLVI